MGGGGGGWGVLFNNPVRLMAQRPVGQARGHRKIKTSMYNENDKRYNKNMPLFFQHVLPNT